MMRHQLVPLHSAMVLDLLLLYCIKFGHNHNLIVILLVAVLPDHSTEIFVISHVILHLMCFNYKLYHSTVEIAIN